MERSSGFLPFLHFDILPVAVTSAVSFSGPGLIELESSFFPYLAFCVFLAADPMTSAARCSGRGFIELVSGFLSY